MSCLRGDMSLRPHRQQDNAVCIGGQPGGQLRHMASPQGEAAGLRQHWGLMWRTLSLSGPPTLGVLMLLSPVLSLLPLTFLLLSSSSSLLLLS
eukprot:scaffold260406_cov18-Prasinocladus_malaysianus.AAC.1